MDGWWFGKGLPKLLLKLTGSKAALDVTDPQTIDERRTVAGECSTALQFGVHTLVDEMDDRVNKAYAGWPTRLYLVGLDGRIVYHGGPGPFGFKPADLGEAIEQNLAAMTAN